MTTTADHDTQAAIDTLAAFFSRCPKPPFGERILGHKWNLDTRACDHCAAPYPIERDPGDEP